MRKYLVLAALLIVAGSFLPEDSLVRTGWQVGVGYLAVAAIAYGTLRHRPAGQAVWWFFAAGVFGNTSGILAEWIVANVLHQEPFPSVADVFFLSLYPMAAIGLAMLIRRRGGRRDWGALVDATTVTTGLGLLAWVFVIHPAAADPSLGLLGHVASITYPVGDVVLVAMTVRLQLGSGTRTPAYWLMTGSLLLFLGGDTAWAVVNQFGWEPGTVPQALLNVTFLFAYTLFGAAALHPSVREVGQSQQPRPPRLSPALLGLLTSASLIAPAVLALQVARHQVVDGIAIVIGCVTLFLLVVTRMAQLLRQVEQQTRKVRELSRTDELTGLPNRRAWTSDLPHTIEQARRDEVHLSVALIDLDHFKAFNDTYGHPAGDRLLKAAAATWQGQLRGMDHLARYGGEEFIVLLPDTTSGTAVEVIDRLLGATPLGQTFSAGLATWDGVETSDELIARADAALYEAKRAGRNQVKIASVGPVETTVPVAA
jgi:diguanylate cyclase (GGDEF)-like protein